MCVCVCVQVDVLKALDLGTFFVLKARDIGTLFGYKDKNQKFAGMGQALTLISAASFKLKFGGQDYHSLHP